MASKKVCLSFTMFVGEGKEAGVCKYLIDPKRSLQRAESYYYRKVGMTEEHRAIATRSQETGAIGEVVLKTKVIFS